jgi:hypothetical protein
MYGIFELRFPNNRPSRYFYCDDLPSRRLRPEILTREQALELAKAFLRAGAAMAIERGWLVMHESGTFVRFTQAGGALLA